MSFGNRSIVLGPGEGEVVSLLGDPYTYKVVGGDTEGNYSLIECTTVADGPPPHIHKAEEEAFYVLEGEVNVTIGDQTIRGLLGPLCSFLGAQCTPFPRWGLSQPRCCLSSHQQGLSSSLPSLMVLRTLIRL
jgi:hypothetical protein